MSISRYVGDKIDYKGNSIYQTPTIINKNLVNNISYEVVTQDNRIDLIARKYYNNPKMWWVIAQFNDIENPMDVKIGTLLQIPSYSDLVSLGYIN